MATVPVVDQACCTSCGLCTELAPNTFALNEDEIAYVTDPAGDPADDIQEAIDGCPAECISWKED
jgi:ferredoxin